MDSRFTPVFIIAMLALLLAVAGCTDTTTPLVPAGATVSPTMTAAPEVTYTLPTISATPGPTETLPPVWEVEVQVQSNGVAINPQVVLTFRGGKGMNLIPRLDMEVIRSDGVVERATMTQPLYVGKTVSLTGTTQYQDRAIVWAVNPQGDRVKVIDQYVPFRAYN